LLLGLISPAVARWGERTRPAVVEAAAAAPEAQQVPEAQQATVAD
jgi:hypothetical protein